MSRADLEDLVHDALRRLPTPPAPHTLLPRVRLAVQQWSSRPWYARAWFTWPIGWQLASIAAFVACVGGAFALAPSAATVVPASIAARASAWSASVASILQHADATVAAARILWRALVAPLLPYAVSVVVLMCLACAVFGTALDRAAFGRT